MKNNNLTHIIRSEIIEGLELIARIQEKRIELAKSLYAKGKVTFLKACKIANMHPFEFISIIPQTELEEEDLELIKEHLK
ncbi:MAG: UPF0175 family protein [Methanosarcinales archaeon]